MPQDETVKLWAIYFVQLLNDKYRQMAIYLGLSDIDLKWYINLRLVLDILF